MRRWSNPKGSHPHWYKLHASTSSNNIAMDKSVKAAQSMNSQSPSLLESMEPQSLLDRLLSPTSPCLTITTENEHSAMPAHQEWKKGPTQTQVTSTKGRYTQRKGMTSSVTNQCINGQRSIPIVSCGSSQTKPVAQVCEMNALKPETSL